MLLILPEPGSYAIHGMVVSLPSYAKSRIILIKKKLLWRNHSGNSDALGGFAPVAGASPHGDDDVLPAT